MKSESQIVELRQQLAETETELRKLRVLRAEAMAAWFKVAASVYPNVDPLDLNYEDAAMDQRVQMMVDKFQAASAFVTLAEAKRTELRKALAKAANDDLGDVRAFPSTALMSWSDDPGWTSDFERVDVCIADRADLQALLDNAPTEYHAGLISGAMLVRESIAACTGREF